MLLGLFVNEGSENTVCGPFRQYANLLTWIVMKFLTRPIYGDHCPLRSRGAPFEKKRN